MAAGPQPAARSPRPQPFNMRPGSPPPQLAARFCLPRPQLGRMGDAEPHAPLIFGKEMPRRGQLPYWPERGEFVGPFHVSIKGYVF